MGVSCCCICISICHLFEAAYYASGEWASSCCPLYHKKEGEAVSISSLDAAAAGGDRTKMIDTRYAWIFTYKRS